MDTNISPIKHDAKKNHRPGWDITAPVLHDDRERTDLERNQESFVQEDWPLFSFSSDLKSQILWTYSSIRP